MKKTFSGQEPSASTSPWHRLESLLGSRRSEVLGHEESPCGVLRLYPLGGWWVAFGQSACHLSRLLPSCGISVLHLNGYPFPVVMASVSDRQVASSRLRTGTAASPSGVMTVSAPPMSQEYYSRWHRETLEGAR